MKKSVQLAAASAALLLPLTALTAAPAQADGPVVDVTLTGSSNAFMHGYTSSFPTAIPTVTSTIKVDPNRIKGDYANVRFEYEVTRAGGGRWEGFDDVGYRVTKKRPTITVTTDMAIDDLEGNPGYQPTGKYTIRFTKLWFSDGVNGEYTVPESTSTTFYVRGDVLAESDASSRGRAVTFTTVSSYYDPAHQSSFYDPWTRRSDNMKMQLQYKSGNTWKPLKNTKIYNGIHRSKFTQTVRERTYRMVIEQTDRSIRKVTPARTVRIKDATRTSLSASRKGTKVSGKISVTRQDLKSGKYKALTSGKATVQYYSNGKWRTLKTAKPVVIKKGKAAFSAKLSGKRSLRAVVKGTSTLASSTSKTVKR